MGTQIKTAVAGHVDFTPGRSHPGALPAIEGPYYGFDEVHVSENIVGQEYLDFVADRYPELAERASGRVDMPQAAHELQWITDQTIDFMGRQSRAGRPFFCHCSFHELSPPCTPPREYAGYYSPDDVPVPELREEDLAGRPAWYRACYEGYVARGLQPDEPTLRRYIASYYGQKRFIDAQFARLLASLDALGIADDTVVLFAADHGLSLTDHWQWRHGPYLFDEVTNVPMIWRVPGLGRQDALCSELVEQVDIMPTFLELCGVPIPAAVQGLSLVPLLRGDPGAAGKECVLLQEREAPDLAARGLAPDSVTQWAVRTREWKLIHYPGQPYGELYDLRNDPGEFVNLWGDAAQAADRARLEGMLMERLMATRDPLPERVYEW